MPADPNPLNYRPKAEADHEAALATRRTLRTWLILSLVWAVGLVVWVVYLALIGMLVARMEG